MKSFALGALLLSLTLANPLHAANWGFGAVLGGGAANFQGPDGDPHGDRTSIVGGASLEAAFNKRLALETGLEYSQAGVLITASPGADLLMDLAYLQVPLLLRLSTLDDPYTGRFYVEGGLQAGYLLSKTATLMVGGQNSSFDVVGLSSTDFRSVLGLGSSFGQRHSLGFEVEWSYSLTTIYDAGQLTLPAGASVPDLRNSWVGARLTYQFSPHR